MAGIISALTTVAKLTTAINSSEKSVARTALETMASSEFELLQTDGSITKLLNKFIVEPTAIVSNELKHEEIMEQVLDSTVDIFCSYYLQAFEVLRTMYGLSVPIVIDTLSTTNAGLSKVLLNGSNKMLGREELRDYLGELLSTEDIKLSIEAHTYSRASKKDSKEVNISTVIMKELEIVIGVRKFTGEKTKTKKNKNNVKDTNDNKDDKDNKEQGNRTEDSYEKILTTEYVVIPILVKTNVIFTNFDNILNMLKPNAKDKTFGYRLDEYKSGAISLLDLIFTGDLIKEYKKNKFKDTDGLIKKLNSSTLSANSKLATNNIIGYEKYYNMIYITSEEKVLLNKHLSGDVMKERHKETFMEEAKALMLTIIDLDYERMILLTKDLKGKSDTTLKALSKRKEGSTDYGEVIKSIMANKPVVF